ncbi:GNAT family N-acetyltransferase [Aurantiacibacter sp. MUD11]|uniref:GNAT family N-acetyltransferase n=1 Tax=Aurantiacibacter sp. MUD11 TaxID=3003265 RepID=UPI0022AB448B|nr:GNAT family N-acetyltransferase [Aurantiacibacter sp. MUD11]WAT18507.1 GNAT family N-acetyltransferase [Aurantiacibacter sp. MUD11]
MTAISYHDTVNDLQDLDWSGEGPFARPEWFALLEQSGMTPLIATARTDGQAVALPLRQGDDGWEALTNWYAFTWRDLRSGGVTSPTLLEELARDLAKHTDRVLLTKLPDEDGTMQRMILAFRMAGWLVFAEPCDTNHVLRVAGRSYAEFLADRPGPLRTTLKRKAKKVEVHVTDSFDPADWAAYEDIYADSWKPGEGDPALLRGFAEAESAAGRYRFAIAHHEGQAVAAQFWTVDGATAYIHKLAHRKDAHKLSPGTTLTAALFERVIDVDGVEMVDFGTGDDPYKRDWMEQVRTRWQLTCLRAASPRNWPLAARKSARKLVSALSHG